MCIRDRLMDEPLTGLDRGKREEIMAYVKAIPERFVHEQQLGTGQQGAPNGDTLFFASGQIGRRAVQQPSQTQKRYHVFERYQMCIRDRAGCARHLERGTGWRADCQRPYDVE